MDRVLINPLIVTGIADAVRAKGKTTEPIKVADLPDAIMNLPEGGGVGEDTSALLDAIGVESREDTGMANGLAIALTDAPLESSWSGERSVADGAPIKDGVAFVSTLKGKTIKIAERHPRLPDTPLTTENGVSWRVVDGVVYVSAPTGATAQTNIMQETIASVGVDHKWLICGCPKGGSLSTFAVNVMGYNDFGDGAIFSYGVYTGLCRIRIYKGAVIPNEIAFKVNLVDLTINGLESISTPTEFANYLGYKSINDVPILPYSLTPNLQSFAPNAVVSKKDGVELGRLPFDLTTIVDAQGNQLFPEGELRSAGSVCDMVDYANNVAVKRIGDTIGADGNYVALAEPIIAPIDPTKAWYPVQSNGSEEAITDNIVPMNAEIRYRVDTESLLTQSASLLRYSNEVTGANDSSLGNAVKTLTDSYK